MRACAAIGLCALAAGGALATTGAPAREASDPYVVPAEPDLGTTVVIARVGGRVTYRPVGTSRSRTLTSIPVEVRFGARVDATRGRVSVTIARNRSGGTSRAEFFDGVFRLAEQERSAPYVATLTLGGRSYADVCGADAAKARSSAAKRRSRKRVRRLWGDGRGRYRTRGRYSAATVRGTKWLTEDRCDGTLTRVARGEVVVEDFTETEPAPAPMPQPQTGGGVEGGGQDGAGSPVTAPAPQRSPRRKQVRVRRGGSYKAAPKA